MTARAQVPGSFVSGRYAAIDIGTVTCRLMVADVDEGGRIAEIERDQAICNLGAGVDRSRSLAPEAIERVGTAVERFMSTVHRLQLPDGGPVTVRAIATSASRDAENAGDFKARLAQAGVEPTVVSGEQEADLAFAGVASAFAGERVAVVDIGGGSTEVIAGQAGQRPVHARSFNVGCRRVTERFLHEDPPTQASMERACSWIAGEMAGYLEELGAEGWFDGRAVAVAGTATSVISVREKMERYDRSRVHKATFSLGDVEGLLGRLSRMTLAERRRVIGLEPNRAPVIVAGFLILQQVMGLARVERITVSESDILHGIILSSARAR